MKTTLGVLYSCRCGIHDVEVAVPVRGEEDVVQWVEKVVGTAIGADHLKRSPHCMERTMLNVKIPMPAGTTKVGGPVQH